MVPPSKVNGQTSTIFVETILEIIRIATKRIERRGKSL
jgi:hypothetical protein